MNKYEKDLSNTSYTNKDFQTIYPEQLELAKKISNRWDPTVSNESDPGVVLIKENAIIADKLNYNCDKNALESMPLSVTQDVNARQLFDLLGYSMKWYQAAEVEVSMAYTKDDLKDSEIISLSLPEFTSVCDADNKSIYTLIENKPIPVNNARVKVKALQGVIADVEINGEKIIKINNLDSNNRIYFNDYNVAENGIFITYADVIDYTQWTKVDNLSLYPSDSKIYKFGVSPSTNSCYVEFPSDILNIIQNGLMIKYIKTEGQQGNIASNVLEKFYNNISIPIDDETTIELNTDTVKITNFENSQGGRDPETIDEAYRNYKKTIGVFNTLVSLRDYTDYIFTEGYEQKKTCNNFVCDRTNDIQASTKILTNIDGFETLNIAVDQNTSGDDKLSAFNLKFYLLQYEDILDQSKKQVSIDEFNKTFTLITNDADKNYIINSNNSIISNTKSLQHDYVDLESNKICFLKNKCPIEVTVVPKYILTELQKDELLANIEKALLKLLSSHNMEFGQELDYDSIYDTILYCDDRIKNIILQDFSYTTFAVYLDDNKNQKEVVVSDDYSSYYIEKNINAGIFTDFTYAEYKNLIKTFPNVKVITTSNGYVYDVKVQGNSILPEIYSELRNEFRAEICAKSILAGVTPWLLKQKEFDYKINQTINPDITNGIIQNVKTISTDLSIKKPVGEFYKLKKNESVLFLAPSLMDDTNYSFYTKYITNTTLPANKSKILGTNEYITFFWKLSDSEIEYHYKTYSSGDILKSTFTISPNNTYQGSQLVDFSTLPGEGTTLGKTAAGTDLAIVIKSLTTGYTIAGSNSVTYQKIATTNIKSTIYAYWVTKRKDLVNNQYILFNENETEYTLAIGEYFIYTDSNRSSLVILEAGTKLTRNNANGNPVWEVPIIDISDIQYKGLNLFEDVQLKEILLDDNFAITQMQFLSLGEGCQIKWTGSKEALNSQATNKADLGTVIYIDTNSAEEHTLTDNIVYKIDQTSPTNNWVGKTYLAINTSSEVPQELISDDKSTQTISLTDTSDNTKNVTSGFIQSSIPLTFEGGDNIDVTFITTDNEDLQTDVYTYSTEGTSKRIINVTEDGSTTISCKLPPNDYLIAINNKTLFTSTGTLVVKYGNSELQTYYGSDIDKTTQGFIYVNLPSSIVSTETTGNITISYTGISVGGTIEVTTILAYKTNTLDNNKNGVQLSVNDVLSALKKFDKKQIFDLSYQPENYIENPLSASAFWDSDHIYNPFTIAQMETYDFDKINILMKTR